MRNCQMCLEHDFPIAPGAIFSGPHSAKFMIVGQAPGITEIQVGRPFNAGSGTRLFKWLLEAGFEENSFRANEYISSVTTCRNKV